MYTSVCSLSSYSRRMAILFQPKYCIIESLALLKADVDGTFVNNVKYLKSSWNSTLLAAYDNYKS
jgi:hypothetical protein